MEQHNFSRRTFLKMAAGTAVGAALFSMPGLSLAKGSGSSLSKQELTPLSFSQLPKDAEVCAKASKLVTRNYSYILEQARQLKDGWLRDTVTTMIQHPTPMFMQQYTSASSISMLYSKLAAAGLIDTGKIDVQHLLPPFSGKVQPFMTAPGSGYGSHHPYPGGLSTRQRPHYGKHHPYL